MTAQDIATLLAKLNLGNYTVNKVVADGDSYRVELMEHGSEHVSKIVYFSCVVETIPHEYS